MSRVRDTQRQRLYDAERRAFGNWPLVRHGKTLKDHKAVEAYVAKVVSRATIQRRYGSWLNRSPIGVKAGRAGSTWSRGGRFWIKMAPNHRIEWIVLHELAHLIQHRVYPNGLGGMSVAGHGPEFCSIYLDLVRYCLGKAAHAALKAEFVAGKVKHRLTKAHEPNRGLLAGPTVRGVKPKKRVVAKPTKQKLSASGKARALAKRYGITIQSDDMGGGRGWWVEGPEDVYVEPGDRAPRPDPLDGCHFCGDWSEVLQAVEEYAADLESMRRAAA